MSNILRVSAAALFLAGCAGSAPPLPKGDWHALNAGRWEFGGNAVIAPLAAVPQPGLAAALPVASLRPSHAIQATRQ